MGPRPGDPDESKAVIARLFTQTSRCHDTVGNGLFRHFGRLLVERLDLLASRRRERAASTGPARLVAA